MAGLFLQALLAAEPVAQPRDDVRPVCRIGTKGSAERTRSEDNESVRSGAIAQERPGTPLAHG